MLCTALHLVFELAQAVVERLNLLLQRRTIDLILLAQAGNDAFDSRRLLGNARAGKSL